MKRSVFYIDGYNLYHAIHNLEMPHLKWLSLYDLANKVVPSKDEQVVAVKFYTATPTHRPNGTRKRHRIYVRALEATGVLCRVAHFHYKRVQCRKCPNVWNMPEEKETDVAIGVEMLRDAMNDVYDCFYLISADNDLMPGIRAVKSEFPEKEFITISPPRQEHCAAMLNICNRKIKLTDSVIGKCLLPGKLVHSDGGIILKPSEYNPPDVALVALDAE